MKSPIILHREAILIKIVRERSEARGEFLKAPFDLRIV